MLTIDESQIRRALAQDNPWWESPDWQPQQTEHKRAYFQGFCELALNLDIQRSVILMGPRRVGKTVMLMQFLRHVMDKGNIFGADKIFYASLDNPLFSNMALDRLIALFEQETACKPEEKRLIIFDEIQYLKDWERHLKVITDKYPNTKFIASGSAAAALRLKSAESGAGRFTNFLLPPLTFPEFLTFTGQTSDIPEELNMNNMDLTIERSKEMDKELQKVIGEFNKNLIDYLNYGSYPEAVLNRAIRENPEKFVRDDIIEKVLLRDLPSLYGIQDPQDLNRLFTMLAYNTGQEVSLQKLSKTSGITKPTIAKYIEYLEAAMLIKTIRRVDDTGKTFKRTHNFKVYLTSPAMRAALFGPISEDDKSILGHLIETAVIAQFVHSSTKGFIHYARWKSGQTIHEVDVVWIDPVNLKPTKALEIKWTDSHLKNPDELDGLIEFGERNNLKYVLVTTKTAGWPFPYRGMLIVPMPAILLCFFEGAYALSGPAYNINAPSFFPEKYRELAKTTEK